MTACTKGTMGSTILGLANIQLLCSLIRLGWHLMLWCHTIFAGCIWCYGIVHAGWMWCSAIFFLKIFCQQNDLGRNLCAPQ